MYIIEQDKQISLIKEMRQLRKNSQKFEVYYHHPVTNQMWKSFFPLAKSDNLGPKLLRHEPAPTDIEKRLQICLIENAPENAIGLGIEWSARPSIWPSIVSALEKEYAHFDRTQLKLFLEHLDLKEAKDHVSNGLYGTEENGEVVSEDIDSLIWRTRKIRLKRFFVLGA